jgi:hypothetical protein
LRREEVRVTSPEVGGVQGHQVLRRGQTLVVELWLYRVADDLSGLTFQEWDPSEGSDDTSAPVTMLVNSSVMSTVDIPLTEVKSLQLDAVTLGDRRTHGVAKKTSGCG